MNPTNHLAKLHDIAEGQAGYFTTAQAGTPASTADAWHTLRVRGACSASATACTGWRSFRTRAMRIW